MKKIILAFPVALLLFSSCKNQATDFPDYTEQNVYFPIQYPVRTLVLGETRLDNSIDQEHAFSVGVCIGGMYENKKDWTVDFEVDNTLIEGIEANGMDGVQVPIEALPEYYYTIEPENTVVIPKGSFTGKMRVNLSDAFFDDENAYKLHYVLPLKITASSCPGILWGTSSVEEPNLHNSADWQTTDMPRYFTLFGIKFINPWHGTFFHRGKQLKNGDLDKTFYYKEFEEGQTASLETAGKMKILYNRMGEFQDGANYQSLLQFSESENGIGQITVSAPEGSPYTISGTGSYYESSTDFAKEYGSWLVDPQTGNETPHLTMTLDYTVSGLNGENYQFVDTLVYRDNGVVYETFSPVIIE